MLKFTVRTSLLLDSLRDWQADRKRQLAEERERGSGSAETVIIIGVLIVIAIGVGAILTDKIIGKANSIHF